MASSFQKRGTKQKGSHASLNGTKASLHNNQLLVSSGIPALDSFLGGGLVVGSVILLNEDRFSTYSNLMLQYFLAEGITAGHGIYLATADQHAMKFLKELPCPAGKEQDKEEVAPAAPEGELKIAWRYPHLPKAEVGDVSGAGQSFCHYYDLTKRMPQSMMDASCFIEYCRDADQPPQRAMRDDADAGPSPYQELAIHLHHEIKDRGFAAAGCRVQTNILRVAVHSLGSPLWRRGAGAEEDCELPRFLLQLKALARSSLAVFFVSLPHHVAENPVLQSRVERIADVVLGLESFAGVDKEQNPLYKEYHGLFAIKKRAPINCLVGQNINTSDLAFKLRRKKFAIEKLHLPPELSEQASRSQLDRGNKPPHKGHLGCSFSGVASPLEF